MNIGIIGSGMISGRYIGSIQEKFPELKICGIASNDMPQCRAKAVEFGLEPMEVSELLACEDIEMVIVLVPVGVHYQLCRQVLEAGKHVYCEKTLTDDPAKARELVALARERGLLIGSAPDTFLGASLQTARRAVDDGTLGEPTSFVIAHNRSNAFFLPRFPFLQQPGAGILYDYGVYYITALVSLLGPVDSVFACVESPVREYPGLEPGDAPIANPNESRVNALIRMRSGVVGTYQANCDTNIWDFHTFKLCGTSSILMLGDCNFFGEPVQVLAHDKFPDAVEELPMLLPTYAEESRGLGACDLARAVAEERAPRASGELACHVLDVLNAMLRSGESGVGESVGSTCERPAPLV